MMYSEFMDFCSTALPDASVAFSMPMPFIIAAATCSLVRDQMSTTLL